MAFVWAIYSLVEATAGAFAGIVRQVGQFLHWTFWGENGLLLGVALALLAIAVGVATVRSRSEALVGRDSGYYLLLGLLVGAVALLATVLIDLSASVSLADGETVRAANAESTRTAQLPVTLLLLIVTGLHLLWFLADIVFSTAKWRRGTDLLARIRRFRIAYYMILPTMFLIGL